MFFWGGGGVAVGHFGWKWGCCFREVGWGVFFLGVLFWVCCFRCVVLAVLFWLFFRFLLSGFAFMLKRD